MPRPFDGTKIVDMGCDLPGTYACMLLGDMGAEVTRVEPLEGGVGRDYPKS